MVSAEPTQFIEGETHSDFFPQEKRTKTGILSLNHKLLVDQFAENKSFAEQNLIPKNQLKMSNSSQETYSFLEDKILLCYKKPLFTWQNIQTDILWHKYSIEKSKFNSKNSDRFLPKIEYQFLLPFYNVNPYYLHLQNKSHERFTFFLNSLKNIKSSKKDLQPVESHTQKLNISSHIESGHFISQNEKLPLFAEEGENFAFDKVKDVVFHKGFTKQNLVFPEVFDKQRFGLSSENLMDKNHVDLQSKFKDQHKNEKVKYQLQNYQRSNQATCLHQYPAVEEGNWVEKGDLIANCSASALGELALGKNILLAYMPWDGYNFEDAILISNRLVNDDVYTSIHIERYEISVKDTEYGLEQITANIPDIPDDLTHLNEDGVAKIGSWVKEGDILVGKRTPIEKELISPYQKLFYSIIEKPEPTTRDTSLRVPKGIQGRVISHEIFEEEEQTSLENFDLTNQLQEETHFSLSSKFNQTSNNTFPFRVLEENINTCLVEPPFCNQIVNNSFSSTPQKESQTIRRFSEAETKPHFFSEKNPINYFSKNEGVTKKNTLINSKTEAKDAEQGIEFFQPSSNFQSRIEKIRKIKSVHLYIVEKRKIQVGDKLAGRHGNKGIVSRILSKQDMPYLPDGTSVDMVLNPLGVPSRMNVGQVFECLLGLAAGWLGDHFKITPFDEIHGSEASRSLVYLKLYQARLKTGQKWLFNPQFPGKVRLFDGRTGDRFDQAVTIGRGYILKLVHMVDEKIHARSTGPYSLVTQQPVRGRSKGGGQRVGEMEVWALEGFGAAYALQELLTVKSDDVKGRRRVFDAILKRKRIFFKTPESFKLLVRELQCLCLDVGIYVETGAFNRTKIDVMDLP